MGEYNLQEHSVGHGFLLRSFTLYFIWKTVHFLCQSATFSKITFLYVTNRLLICSNVFDKFLFKPSFSCSNSSRVSCIPTQNICSIINSLLEPLFCKEAYYYSEQVMSLSVQKGIKLNFPLLVTPKRLL